MSPKFYAANVNAAIKSVLTKLSIPHAPSCSAHGFRRRAAQELKEMGSQWPTVATLGEWMSLAFKGCGETALDSARDMSKLLIESGDLSGGDYEVFTAGSGAHGRIRSTVGCWYPVYYPRLDPSYGKLD